MASKHYNLKDKEIKVKDIKITNYFALSEEEQEEAFAEFKENISNE